jgi:signal peptide peptidase SppA
MSIALPHIASRIFNTPLLMAPDKLQAVLWALSQRMDVAVEAPDDPGVMRPAAAVGRWETRDSMRGSGMLIDGGVGILPITGSLVHRGTWIGTSSGLQSYDGIAQQLRIAAEDDRIKAVLLDLNSYGGEAGGVADLAQEVRDLAATKPVRAMINDAAASAAYWIAAAAQDISITETGIAGSIGVVLTHQDISAAAEKAGVKITQIHAGANKLLGSPFKALSDADMAQLQESVDQLYALFTSRVDAYRGGKTNARATEARIYRGQAAVDAGLADQVTTGRALLAEMQAEVANRGKSRTSTRSNTMSGSQSGGADAAVTEAQMTAAKASQFEAGKKSGVAEATTAERARVKAIVTAEQAKGREEMAAHLAFDTDLSAEQATALLAKSPKVATEAPAPKGKLDAAIRTNGGTPDVGTDAGDPAESVDAVAKRIAALA